MIEAMLAYGFIIIISAYLFFGAAIIIGSGWYDIRHQPGKAKKYSRKPRITVIIVSKNHQNFLQKCVESVLASGYKKCNIIIVNNVSDDKSKFVAKQIIAQYPQSDIRLLAKRKASSFEKAVHQASKKYPSSDVMLAIDGNSFLAPSTLNYLAEHFRANPGLEEIYLNERILPSTSLFGLWQRFTQLQKWQRQKLVALIKKNSRTLYAGQAVIFTQPDVRVKTFLPRRNTLAFMLSFLEFLGASYIFYVAYALQNTGLLAVSVAALVSWLGFIVWSAESMKLKEKLWLSFSIPTECILLLLHTLLRIFAVSKLNHRESS